VPRGLQQHLVVCFSFRGSCLQSAIFVECSSRTDRRSHLC
jgi:hypothetical protein